MAYSKQRILSVGVKYCEACDAPFRISDKGDVSYFAKRRFCSPQCAARATARHLPLVDRLNQKLDKSGDCWLWTGCRSKAGYGLFSYRNRLISAHRAAFIAFRCEDPSGKVVCHKCDTPACCNPDHLFLGTQGDNIRDMHSKGRAGCAGVKGSKHHSAKLTEADILSIRSSACDASTLADQYGITRTSIYLIRSRKTWRHI